MMREQGTSAYYRIDEENSTVARVWLYSHIPQVALTMKGTSEHVSLSVGFYTGTTVGNTILYEYDTITSAGFADAPVMIKLLSTMFIHNQTQTYGKMYSCHPYL